MNFVQFLSLVWIKIIQRKKTIKTLSDQKFDDITELINKKHRYRYTKEKTVGRKKVYQRTYIEICGLTCKRVKKLDV